MTFSAHLPMNLAISGLSSAHPKGKKPNNWLQETWWYIRLSQSVFVILTMRFLKKKRRKYDFDCFSPPDFLGY